MRPGKVNSIATEALVAAAVRGELDQAQALRLCRENPEIVALALLAAARRIAELQSQVRGQGSSPATPSAMVPLYAKASAPKRRKRPGARKGHPGARRGKPTRIDRRVEHRLKRCPHCHGPVQRCKRKRTLQAPALVAFSIEDIPEHITPLVTEHTIQRDYCPACQKHVEPVVADALPNATLGHHVVGLSSWFHYGLGMTIDQVVDILGYHLQTRLTPGGLVDAWRRLAVVLMPWYEQIGQQARDSAVLHADAEGDR